MTPQTKSIAVFADRQTGEALDKLKEELKEELIGRPNFFQLYGDRKVELERAIMVVPDMNSLVDLQLKFGDNLEYYGWQFCSGRFYRYPSDRIFRKPGTSYVASAAKPVRHAIYMFSFGTWYMMDANNEWQKISAQEILDLAGTPPTSAEMWKLWADKQQ